MATENIHITKYIFTYYYILRIGLMEAGKEKIKLCLLLNYQEAPWKLQLLFRNIIQLSSAYYWEVELGVRE